MIGLLSSGVVQCIAAREKNNTIANEKSLKHNLRYSTAANCLWICSSRSFIMGHESAVYLAKLAEQAERYEG